MRVNVIACGESARHWDGRGHSIGVNDCWKLGKPTDALLVVDSFQGDGDHDRAKIIRASRPCYFFSQMMYWSQQPGFRRIRLRRFNGELRKGEIYHNHASSPFIAISLASTCGFTEIVLWGVDFVDHPVIRGELLERQLVDFALLIACLTALHITVRLGVAHGALKQIIPALHQNEKAPANLSIPGPLSGRVC